MDITNYEVIVVGAGLSGIVMAERFSSILKKKVLVIEKEIILEVIVMIILIKIPEY